MKCVKHNETGKIMRVDNMIAHKHVFLGGWSYIPKEEWKRNVRDKNKQHEGENHA